MKNFKHGGGGGDMLYGLATMKQLGGGILNLNIDNSKKFYRSLLEKQSYIKKLIYHQVSASKWKKFNVDYNLDLFREQPFNGGYTILECHAMAFNLKFNFTLPWIENIESKSISEIIINDTGELRWPGNTLNWEKLEKYKKRCVFIGLKHEYHNFIRDRFKVDFYEIKDALEFTQIIKGSKVYVGNQSTGLALAEGIKANRFADLYIGKSKQYPKGENGHYEFDIKLLEKYLFEEDNGSN